MTQLTDSRGCLTPVGVRTLASAPPGEGPAELVAHVAACGRCQERLLAIDRRARDEARRGGMWRLVLLCGVGLLAMFLAMLATSLVTGR